MSIAARNGIVGGFGIPPAVQVAHHLARAHYLSARYSKIIYDVYEGLVAVYLSDLGQLGVAQAGRLGRFLRR